MSFKSIFITGGAGYAGSCLVPELLKKGYKVTVYDLMYYTDNFLPKDNPNLEIIKGDIRDKEKIYTSCLNHDVFIHLACISNDTSFALDEKLSTSINLDAFEPMVESAKNAGIKRFIYASSSSVYGISEEKNVTEDHPLVPLTLYNKYKALCEPILFKHTDENFKGVIFRPATVCGYSPRMRYDLTVNALTHSALKKKIITVNGGGQIRPNIHIEDLVDLYIFFLNKNKKFCGIYNAGFENLSVLNIAKKVQEFIPTKIKIIKKNYDPRSYRLDSSKLLKIGFKPKHKIINAIQELKNRHLSGRLIDHPKFHSIEWLKKLAKLKKLAN